MASFEAPPSDPQVSGADVHVWRLPLALSRRQIEALRHDLCADEQERAARFRFDVDRDRFVVAHGGIRSVLAQYVGMEPRQLRFRRGPYGKPAMAEGQAGGGVEFNLTHSGEWALVAVARGRAVGVDIERARTIPEMEGVARSVFTPAEHEGLLRVGPSERFAAFYRLWTRKEAIIKAIGSGLSTPLDRLDVQPAAAHEGASFTVASDPDMGSAWNGRSFAPAEGYEAAVAVEGVGLRVVYWQWQPATP